MTPSIIIFQPITKKLLPAFLDAKSITIISRSMLSKISFSMLHIAEPFMKKSKISKTLNKVSLIRITNQEKE